MHHATLIFSEKGGELDINLNYREKLNFKK